jgi:hypothetical protein
VFVASVGQEVGSLEVKAEYRDYLPGGVRPTREEVPW